MRKSIIGLSIAAILALTLVVTGCSGAGTVAVTGMSSQQQGIWVNGTGEIKVEPDIFNLSLGIVSQEKTLGQAQATAATAMDKVLDALKNQGIADKDIQTSRFNVRQVTQWNRETEENEVTGYEVSNMVTVKVRKIDEAGTVIDAVVAAGGDLTRINSMGFAIDDDSDYRDQARELAGDDARARAEQLAKLAGVKLGQPTYVTETSYSPPIIMRSYIEATAAPPMMDGAQTSIIPGELTVTVSVQIVYAIE
jgi:uncharacterized protein YggE